MSGTLSLKSVSCSRVSTGAAQNAFGEARHTGKPAFCPVGSQYVTRDIYGRQVVEDTHSGRHLDASCGVNQKNTVRARLEQESRERPIPLGVKSDTYCSTDLYGVHMDLQTKNLYGRGQF